MLSENIRKRSILLLDELTHILEEKSSSFILHLVQIFTEVLEAIKEMPAQCFLMVLDPFIEVRVFCKDGSEQGIIIVFGELL